MAEADRTVPTPFNQPTIQHRLALLCRESRLIVSSGMVALLAGHSLSRAMALWPLPMPEEAHCQVDRGINAPKRYFLFPFPMLILETPLSFFFIA